MSGALKDLPSWVELVNRNVHFFSPAGFHALMDYAGSVNELGEAIACEAIKIEQLDAWVRERVEKQRSASETSLPEFPLLHSTDPTTLQLYWKDVLTEMLGKVTDVSRPQVLRPKTIEALRKYRFLIMRIPAITEDDYPIDFLRPVWGKDVNGYEIKRRPCKNLWVAVETIQPSCHDDPFAKALEIDSRFGHPLETVTKELRFKATQVLGVSRKQVRLPSAEERNWIANVFLWLNKNRNATLPDLDCTDYSEWCSNAFNSKSLGGGIHYHNSSRTVKRQWIGGYKKISFRYLVVLGN
ncbi:MAG: hypothetical protein ABIH21_00895 [Patescibacteria group bacterium]